MNRLKVSRPQFVVLSCLSLTVILSLSYIADLRLEQVHLQETVNELRGVYEENRDMTARLDRLDEQLSQLQRHNEALEELLFRRAQTYLIVTEGLSFSEDNKLPSRSGLEGMRQPFSAVEMPVQSSSGLMPEDFEYVWRVYGAHGLFGTGAALIAAEENYQINALVLAAIIVHESRWGKSAIARNRNNLAGLGAFDGSAGYSAMSFDTKEDCIYYLAALLSRDYVNPAGRHFHGPHLAGIGRAYASDAQWANKVAGNMRLIVETAVANPDKLLAYALRNLD